jgi:hypothetical protein
LFLEKCNHGRFLGRERFAEFGGQRSFRRVYLKAIAIVAFKGKLDSKLRASLHK